MGMKFAVSPASSDICERPAPRSPFDSLLGRAEVSPRALSSFCELFLFFSFSKLCLYDFRARRKVLFSFPPCYREPVASMSEDGKFGHRVICLPLFLFDLDFVNPTVPIAFMQSSP